MRFPHWVCRAKGDQGEGWRSGFNLKGWNDGTFIDTSCTFGAHGDEVSKQEFECLCSMPFPYLEEPDIIVGLGYGAPAAIYQYKTAWETRTPLRRKLQICRLDRCNFGSFNDRCPAGCPVRVCVHQACWRGSLWP